MTQRVRNPPRDLPDDRPAPVGGAGQNGAAEDVRPGQPLRVVHRLPDGEALDRQLVAVDDEHVCARLGADHVLWGTDSVWYGSPQWQIEAMRRLEIPADMQKQHGFAPLGPADGVVKSAIFSGNAVRLYRLDVKAALGGIGTDRIAALRAEYVAQGGMRSNTRYGYVARRSA